jgi:hypothetical protein
VLAVLSVGLTAVGAWQAWATFEPLFRYRPAPATVISARVQSQQVTSRSNGIRRTRLRFAPDVAYRLTVNGETYLGTHYSATTSLGSRAEATRIVNGLVPGTGVVVWYDPADPSRSVMNRDPDPRMLFFVIVPIVLGVLSWMLMRPPYEAEPAVEYPDIAKAA